MGCPMGPSLEKMCSQWEDTNKCVIAFESYPHIMSVNSKDNFASKKGDNYSKSGYIDICCYMMLSLSNDII